LADGMCSLRPLSPPFFYSLNQKMNIFLEKIN